MLSRRKRTTSKFWVCVCVCVCVCVSYLLFPALPIFLPRHSFFSFSLLFTVPSVVTSCARFFLQEREYQVQELPEIRLSLVYRWRQRYPPTHAPLILAAQSHRQEELCGYVAIFVCKSRDLAPLQTTLQAPHIAHMCT